MKITKKQILWTIAIFSCTIAVITITVHQLFFDKTFQITEDTYLYIDEDDNVDSVIVQLSEKGRPKIMRGFELLAHWKDYKVKSGRYKVAPQDNIRMVFNRLRWGQQTPIRLVVPSVRTIPQLSQTLGKRLMIDSTTIATYLTDSSVCRKYGYEPHTIVSMMVPNTYEVYWNTSIEKFAQRMQKEHQNFWNEERMHKAELLGMSQVEISTLASIVDEETIRNAEKPMVAGMYLNRLRIGMMLQADPTVKFALQDFGLRRIYHKHLLIDSPYNTYKNKGLPPGPIRIASIAGIDAVLNYTPSKYLYMCAKEDFSGYHNFARNYSEHRKNAAQYTKALNKRKIK